MTPSKPIPARYFNPRSPHGERPLTERIGALAQLFQSTLPARGATCPPGGETPPTTFQSTLPARGATHSATAICRFAGYFNPRSPHGERRLLDEYLAWCHRFQSTLPARGATPSIKAGTPDTILFQSTLPARGATTIADFARAALNISIHAPRTGSDAIRAFFDYVMTISIHAPRTGSDEICEEYNTYSPHFNPRSPHGERPEGYAKQIDYWAISIHAPRTGSDGWQTAYIPLRRRNFNPRSPHGERRNA